MADLEKPGFRDITLDTFNRDKEPGRDALVPGSACLLSGKRGLGACLIEPCAFEGLGLVQ